MSQSSSQTPDSWIAQFCGLVGHEYFAEVSEEFIEDDFNLTGLQSQVPMYKEALEMILDVEPSEPDSSMLSGDEIEEEEQEEEEDDDGLLGEELDEPAQNGGARQSAGTSSNRRHNRTNSDTSVIESSAELLYGLIHARYITSRPGIQQMMEKYELSHFGYCPRVNCGGIRVVPIGLTDTPGQQTVKLFCPSCLDAYTPPNSRFQAVDGAFFGTTFGCLFFMTFPDLEFAPPKRKATKENNANAGNEDAESVVGQGERGGPGMTASRSSSLTLPNPPAVAGSSTQQNDKGSQGTAVAAIPPQPASINGVATQNLAPGLGKGKIYEPRIYGFKVSERAKGGPRMKWLRSRPQDVNTLDEARLYHEVFGGEVDGELEQKTSEESTPANVPHDNDGDAVMAGQQSRPVARKSSKRKGPSATATRRTAEDPEPPEAG
ncbi:Casein kinase II subunit beta-1 [Cyphellophora attinorum]|uniref:Casein kinase II subunit beta n=1 Tax=Cyphellophora attinorum TaxID=1664694 RepID=A0A0N1NWS9_9EURO|nr:Casein kinase II subunit beta-1 [Phialophora attinorum]KPI34315.1 Casein kinase II subunit beta-1 [Phialophora attinorum]